MPSQPSRIYSVDLFGGLRVRDLRTPSSAPLTRFRTKQTGALLGYLALHAGKPQSREVLIELLWPDVSPDSARARLSNALSSLRSQMEAAPMAFGSVFQADRLTVGVSRLATTDVARFQSLIDEASALKNDDAGKERLLVAALALFHSELLSGYYDPWVTEEQDRLTERAREALSWLAKYTAHSDRLAAIRYARQATTLGFDEEIEDLLESLESTGATPSPSPSVATPPSRHDSVLEEKTEKPLVRDNYENGETVESSSEFLGLSPPLTRFLGREVEQGQLLEWVADAIVRLIIVTGPAGVGKSRLLRESISQIAASARRRSGRTEAAAIARAAPPSIHAVDLVSLTAAHELPLAIASAIGLETDQPATVRTIAEAIRAVARPVILLDNAEHLLPDLADWLESLLALSPNLVCVVTSRAVTGVAGERVLDLRPLALPPADADTLPFSPDITSTETPEWPRWPSDCPSVALFLDRARYARPDFALTASNADAIRTIVTAADGLPLAIELAAAWGQVMTTAEIRRRLTTDRFAFLKSRGSHVAGWGKRTPITSDSSVRFRHASLHNIIAASVSQLPEEERTILAALSVFRGGWTTEAAEAITGSEIVYDHLAVLCDWSLITAQVVDDPLSDGGTTVRFAMLESVREYASQHIEPASGILGNWSERHALYYADFAAVAASRLQGAEQTLWLNRLHRDDANLRMALAWSTSDYSENGLKDSLKDALKERVALSMGAAMGRYWSLRGPVSVGRDHLTAALSRHRRRRLPHLTNSTAEANRALLSKAENSAGILAMRQGDREAARRHYRAALFLDQRSPDVAEPEIRRNWLRRRAAILNNVAHVEQQSGRFERAYAYYDESLHLWREMGELRFVCVVLHNLAFIDRELGRIREAILNLRESIDVASDVSVPHCEAMALTTLGEIRQSEGNLSDADRHYRDALAIAAPLGDTNTSIALLFDLGTLLLDSARVRLSARTDRSVRSESANEDARLGSALLASALRAYINTGTARTAYDTRQETRLRAVGLWPISLVDLDLWQRSGLPLSMSLSEAIETASKMAYIIAPKPQPSLNTNADVRVGVEKSEIRPPASLPAAVPAEIPELLAASGIDITRRW